MKKLLTISLALLSFVSISCEASNHQNQSGVKSSISTEKTRAINLNLMLKEVFETRITDIASQRADVSHIVSKYLHSGMDKKEISDLISDQFEILEKDEISTRVDSVNSYVCNQLPTKPQNPLPDCGDIGSGCRRVDL